MKLLKLLKYYLGFKSIVKVGDKFYVVRGMFFKEAMDKDSDYWWCSKEFWHSYCAFGSYEEAQQAINLYKVVV